MPSVYIVLYSRITNIGDSMAMDEGKMINWRVHRKSVVAQCYEHVATALENWKVSQFEEMCIALL